MFSNPTELRFATLIISSLLRKKTADPLTNVNLSPFWQWRSAYECLQNRSSKCGPKQLTMAGIIQVTGSELTDYCTGCKPWTLDLLTCVESVKRDFWFINYGTVEQIRDAINHGCNTNTAININATAFKKSSGMRNFRGTYMALFSALVMAIFLFST
ncbi:hypothetical protein BT93_J1203 [Corymbia citriodora subsp. variegata]|nr:hypothetical protein BT93_J1203 [Corymbia citriodora subsp. variegata]